jgi:hypothetical protein
MTPDVIQVTALPDHKLQIQFENGELKIFDMTPYLQYQAFSDLRHANLFMRAKVLNGTVVWTEDIDISPDTLYLKGTTISSSKSSVDLTSMVV